MTSENQVNSSCCVNIINAPNQEFVDIIDYVITHKFTLLKPITVHFKDRPRFKSYGGLWNPFKHEITINLEKHLNSSKVTICHELRHVEQSHYKLMSGKHGKTSEKDARVVGMQYWNDFKKHQESLQTLQTETRQNYRDIPPDVTIQICQGLHIHQSLYAFIEYLTCKHPLINTDQLSFIIEKTSNKHTHAEYLNFRSLYSGNSERKTEIRIRLSKGDNGQHIFPLLAREYCHALHNCREEWPVADDFYGIVKPVMQRYSLGQVKADIFALGETASYLQRDVFELTDFWGIADDVSRLVMHEFFSTSSVYDYDTVTQLNFNKLGLSISSLRRNFVSAPLT